MLHDRISKISHLQILIQEIENILIRLRSVLVEVDIVARPWHQVTDKRLSVGVIGLCRFPVYLCAVAIADDLDRC
jgi:hypothetical protein